MNRYGKELKRWLTESMQTEEGTERGSLYDFLCSEYLKHHPIETIEMENELERLEPILKNLSERRKRRVVNTVRTLCGIYAEKGFLEGMRVGACLIMEFKQ